MDAPQELFELLKAFFDGVSWPYEPEAETEEGSGGP